MATLSTSRALKTTAILDLKGLDLTMPVDLLSKDGRTPFAKNFRLYAQQSDDRRVAVSSRKGPEIYTTPLGETLVISNTSTTGAGTTEVGYTLGQHAQPFTANSNDRLTRIDINVGDTLGGSGPLMVRIYSDSGDKPYKLLTESSISSGDIGTMGYKTARFINAIKLVNTTKYWIILSQQDDGTGSYTLSTTTAGDKAFKTDSTLYGLTEQLYALNYKIYTSTDATDKNSYRFNRDNGLNTTLVPYNTTMYYVDETTSSLVSLVTGLSSSATEYSFTNGDNKVFWVNGYDQLTSWDGTRVGEMTNTVTNSIFESGTTGWAGTATTLLRDSNIKHSGTYSLALSAASGTRIVDGNITTTLNKVYDLDFWIYSTTDTTVESQLRDGVNADIPVEGTTVPANTWTHVTKRVTATRANTLLRFYSNDNFYIDDVYVYDTGIEYIVDTELPILSQIIMHKNRLMGVTAADPNKIVFSEEPGNPSNSPANEQWYRAWLSISSIYAPRPHNGSPITKIESFQDSLTIFTQDKKYVLSGLDRGSYNLRESTGNKGALSTRGVASDENRIYFVGNDGLYEFNGSADTKLSDRINPLFDACPLKDKITPVIWKNEVRFYMASELSTVNDSCVIYNKDLKEWQYDTNTFTNRAVNYKDADDDDELIEFSSLTPTLMNAEQEYNSLGAPIDFEYRLNYMSMDTPAQKKHIKRYFPLLQGVDSTFKIQLAMDKDFEDSPRVKDVLMSTNGSKFGLFNWGDGTLYGGSKSFKQHRQSYSGYAYYWQLRVSRNGVNNRVAFIGAEFSYKTKRL